MSHTQDYGLIREMFPQANEALVKQVRDRCASLDEAMETLLNMTDDALRSDPAVEDDCVKLQEMFPAFSRVALRAIRAAEGSLAEAAQAILEGDTAAVQAEPQQPNNQEGQPQQQQQQPNSQEQPQQQQQQQRSSVRVEPSLLATTVISSALELVSSVFKTTAQRQGYSSHCASSSAPSAATPAAPPAAAATSAPSTTATTTATASTTPTPATTVSTTPEEAAAPAQLPAAPAGASAGEPSLATAKSALLNLLPEQEVERMFVDVPDAQITITVAGKRHSGKTSILNAMLGQPLLASKTPMPVNYTVRRNDALTVTVSCQDKSTSCDLAGASVGKVRVMMQEAVKAVTTPPHAQEQQQQQQQGGDATAADDADAEAPPLEVEVRGPGVVPVNIVLREAFLQDVAQLSCLAAGHAHGGGEQAGEGVVVVVVNHMTDGELCAAQAFAQSHPMALLVRTELAGAQPQDTQDAQPADVLLIDPLTYLSSIILSVHQPGTPPYTGAFVTFKSRVHSLIQQCREAKKAREHALWRQVHAVSAKKCAEWDSLREYCKGVAFDELSRPPPCTEVPSVVEEAQEQYTPQPADYAPAEPTYQPQEPYVPADSDYVPAVSTWQPSN